MHKNECDTIYVYNNVQIINLNNENDRDEIQTIGIKINGIISVTVNMTSRIVTFYTTRENVKKTLAQSLRSNGFQVQTDEEKDFDDVASMHSGVSNFTDVNNKQAQLASLMHGGDGQIRFRAKSTNSIIAERYQYEQNENGNGNGNNSNSIVSEQIGNGNDKNNNDEQYVDNSANNSLLSPSYFEPQNYSRYDSLSVDV